MRHLILLLAALLPAVAYAVEKGDTTFTVKDKKIVVSVDSGTTTVKVYNSDGYRLSKTREMEFVDGQEVEHVFVGSPFVPAENLQNMSFRPHYATVWFGMNFLTKGAFTNSSDGLHSRRTGSFELGVTPYSIAVPFNKGRTFGLTAAVQLAWVHQCFRRGYAMANDGGRIAYTQLEGDAKGNSINYGALRIPVMLSVQRDYESFHMSLGLSAEVRTNAEYRFKPSAATGDVHTPDGLKLRRFGLNLEYSLGMGPVILSATAGLTPLFKTGTGKNAYSMSAKVGLDVLELVRIVKGKNKRR